MNAIYFGPFSGIHQACQYKSHLKNGSKFTFVTQLHRKCTKSTFTYSIIGLHFNVCFTIIRDGRQHISYAH